MQPALLALTALALLAALLLAVSPGGGPDPSPDLTPAEVVRLQVEALQRNDDPAPDAGIATVFRFASPSNQAATGPLDRFAEMVKGPVYGDMLYATDAVFAPIAVDGDRAAQRVTLAHADGRRATYRFHLTRQDGGPCDGCWLTDGVVRQEPEINGTTRI